jgi:uncharacterized protein
MVDKKKKVKGKGVSKAIKSFLKRKTIAVRASVKRVTAKKKPEVKKAEPAASQKKAKQETIVRRPAPVKTQPKAPKKAAAAVPVEKKKAQAAGRACRPSEKNGQAMGPKYFFKSDIPEGYDETYMRALPRDPEWLFVYWEISEATRDELKSRMGEAAYGTAKKILRVLDVTDVAYDGTNAQRYTDIEINDYANNWYVRVPDGGKSFVMEFGYLTADGRFHSAVRSNTITIPRFGISPVMDEEWNTVNTDELLRLSGDSLKQGMGSSEKHLAAVHGAFGMASGSGSGGLSSGRF